MTSFTKGPNAELDYVIDWTAWLAGDKITTSTWTVPSGLTKMNDSKTQQKVTAWISGGEIGATYTVTNRISTLSGRTDERSFEIQIEQL